MGAGVLRVTASGSAPLGSIESAIGGVKRDLEQRHTQFDNLTLVGQAEVLTDQQSKTKHWQEPFIHIYPGGDSDPNYCVIKFTTKRVSLNISHEGAESTTD